MQIKKKKQKIIGSSAVLISIIIHIFLLSLAGGIVALKYFKRTPAKFKIEEQKALERKKLELPIETKPFMSQMSKPQSEISKKITTTSPAKFTIPEQSNFIKMAPLPSFQGSYTNFNNKDRRLVFNSKYREIDFGISKVDFFGTKSSAEKIVIIIDSSNDLVHDRMGGLEVFKLIYEDTYNLITNLRSSTLFNLIVFDGDKILSYENNLIPATAIHKTNMLNWVSNINTNSYQIGLTNSKYKNNDTINYYLPMEKNDITGWLGAFNIAAKLKPETIFILTSNWGNITDLSLANVSYFSRKKILQQYLDARLEYLIKYEKNKFEEFPDSIDELYAISLKMLELENQERDNMLIDHKILHNWDDILKENNVEMPSWIECKDPGKINIFPSETRYSYDEVLETFFTIAMNNYKQLGLPQINFILAPNKRTIINNYSDEAPLMSSQYKFFRLSRMINGRVRKIPVFDSIDNELYQNEFEVRKLIDDKNESNL